MKRSERRCQGNGGEYYSPAKVRSHQDRSSTVAIHPQPGYRAEDQCRDPAEAGENPHRKGRRPEDDYRRQR